MHKEDIQSPEDYLNNQIAELLDGELFDEVMTLVDRYTDQQLTESDVQAAWNDGKESMKDEPVYVLTVFNRKPDGLEVDMEILDARPNTDNDPDNWPRDFEVRVAHINGGDSRLIEQRISGITTHKEPAY